MKTRMATFLNDESLFEQTVANMESIYADKRIFMEKHFAKSDDWKNFLVSIFSNRQAMLDKIEENIANGKIKKRIDNEGYSKKDGIPIYVYPNIRIKEKYR